MYPHTSPSKAGAYPVCSPCLLSKQPTDTQKNSVHTNRCHHWTEFLIFSMHWRKYCLKKTQHANISLESSWNAKSKQHWVQDSTHPKHGPPRLWAAAARATGTVLKIHMVLLHPTMRRHKHSQVVRGGVCLWDQAHIIRPKSPKKGRQVLAWAALPNVLSLLPVP